MPASQPAIGRAVECGEVLRYFYRVVYLLYTQHKTLIVLPVAGFCRREHTHKQTSDTRKGKITISAKQWKKKKWKTGKFYRIISEDKNENRKKYYSHQTEQT
jgi:hypothetical protein